MGESLSNRLGKRFGESLGGGGEKLVNSFSEMLGERTGGKLDVGFTKNY